ncbi:hypothetical protein DL768_004881 [Monosporascus sp. mg162]|nr:hypothetical protein DL768_004881 [Monosporascus sp. mg162]
MSLPESTNSSAPQPNPRSSHDLVQAQTAGLTSLLEVPRPRFDHGLSSTEDSTATSKSPEESFTPRTSQSPPVEPSCSTGKSGGGLRNDLKAAQLSHRPKTTDDLWSEAYDCLKEAEETKELMEMYEKILSSETLQKSLNLDCAGADERFSNRFANLQGDQRCKEMQSIAQRGLKKMEEQGSSKFIAGIGRVIKLVDQSQQFIGTALQSCASASLAWAGVCLFVLPAIVSGFDQLGKKREGLDYVNNRIRCTGLHRLLLRSNWNQKNRLSGIKAIEAELETRISLSLKYEVRENLGNLVRQGKEQLGILGKINEAMQELLKLEKYNIQQQIEKRARVQLARFDGTQYENTFNKIPDRKDGTGSWLLSHDKYLRWEASDTGLLVIEANPGRGKSVLAKWVVNKMKRDTSKTTCYFFFNGDIENHNTASTALRSLLNQLFASREDILQTLGDEIEKIEKRSFTNDIGALWKIFDSATSKCRRGEVVCIFDALDECKETDMQELLRKVSSRIADGFIFDFFLPHAGRITSAMNSAAFPHTL